MRHAERVVERHPGDIAQRDREFAKPRMDQDARARFFKRDNRLRLLDVILAGERRP